MARRGSARSVSFRLPEPWPRLSTSATGSGRIRCRWARAACCETRRRTRGFFGEGSIHPTPFAELAEWVLTDLEARESIFDIARDRWFEPHTDDAFRLDLGDETIAAPFGVAAGPHTQLAGGIVASWLCGARLLELKTVQRRGVEVVRPCIRMRDEGLNVEWSQELEPEESFTQYLDAWALIHALHRRLGWPGAGPQTVFDISVGYDFEGLLSAPMRRYFALVTDAGEALRERLQVLATLRSDLVDLEVPSRLARRVTLSSCTVARPRTSAAWWAIS